MVANFYTVSSNTACWVNWNCSTSTATATSATEPIWTYWADSASTTTVNSTWVEWATFGNYEPVATNQPSAYEVRDWEAVEKRRKEREESDKKAEQLLKENLSAEQCAEYEKDGFFHVVSESGERYRVRKGSLVGNVDVIEKDGKVKHSLCAHPEAVPKGDALLSQKLMLETDEDRFLSIANVHPARVG